MKSPRFLSPALAAVLMASAPVQAADAPAAPAPAGAPAPTKEQARHQDALKTVFLETRVIAMARASILAQVKPGYQRELSEFFFRMHSDEDLAAAYARTVGPSISPGDSAGALRVARSPQMREMMAEYELLMRQKLSTLTPTPKIARLAGEIQRAANPADVQAMGRVTPFSKGVAPFLVQQIRAVDTALATKFKARMDEMIKLSWRSDLKREHIPRERIGLASLDRVLDVWVASLERLAAAMETQRQDYAKLRLDTLLESQYMTNREGIERARKMVDEAERINQVYLATLQEDYATRIEALRETLKELPRYAEKDADAVASEKLKFLIDLNETRQRGYAAYRRMLSFAESRIGTTRLFGEKLVFATDEDLRVWRDMGKEVEQLFAQDVDKNAALLKKEGQAPQEAPKTP